MKKKYLTYILLLFLSVIGCEKDNPNDSNAPTKFDVSGSVLINSVPIENVTVDIDDLELYRTTTNEEGWFVIKDVSVGEHKLNAVIEDYDQSFVQKSYDIDVNSNLELDNLLLPNPVIVKSALDSTTNIVTIHWNKSFDEDFREYKLYSHHNSGLDETTGTLEHVTIDRNDTIKEIQLESNTLGYFRVFVMNDYGKLGGSNIIDVTSSFINLLTYGNFEDPDAFFSTWTTNVYGNVSIVDSNQLNGNFCILLQAMIDTAEWSCTHSEFRSPQILLQENEEYELSFWYKWKKGFSHHMYPLYFYYRQDNENYLNVMITPPGPWIYNQWILIEEDIEWTYHSISFYPNSSSAAKFYFEGNIDELYFDDIQLKKILKHI